MAFVAYFTAVMAKVGRAWKARDVEVDETETLEGLVDALRAVSVDDQPVLAVVEHEDEWFALARVDLEEEPRLFVSDFGAASHSPFGDLLASAADVDVPDDEDSVGEADDDSAGDSGAGSGDSADEAENFDDEVYVAVWAGEPDLLEDFGVSARTLRILVEDNADDPGAVLGVLGETVGFAELLEALR
jgi:putative tRNA adenosine deaminase-associated protein